VTPLGIILLVCVAIPVAFFPRRTALGALLFGLIYLTQGAPIAVAGFSFNAIRFLGIIAFLRVLLRRESATLRLNNIDKGLLLAYVYVTIIPILRADIAPIRIAVLLDISVFYFAFRSLISGFDDVRFILRLLPFLLIPFVVLLGYEMLTAKNPFTLLGADREGWIRDTRVRCFGSFRHPSLMGTLGASLFPIFIGALFHPRTRVAAIVGLPLCLFAVVASNSGGPLSAWALGVVGWSMWTLRNRMHIVRRCLFAGLVMAALMMSTPIWYVIESVSKITGGTGWHRAYLIEVAFRKIGDWWFMGMPLIETRGWMPTVLSSGVADITNQFIAFGVAGGLLAMLLFVRVYVLAYRQIGRATAILRFEMGDGSPEQRLLWGFGVALAVHVASWLGISYFDKMSLIWILQLACISAATQHIEDDKDFAVNIREDDPVQDFPKEEPDLMPHPADPVSSERGE
jgi:hypothetical protein